MSANKYNSIAMSDYDKNGRFRCVWSRDGQGNGCPSWTKDNSDPPEGRSPMLLLRADTKSSIGQVEAHAGDVLRVFNVVIDD